MADCTAVYSANSAYKKRLIGRNRYTSAYRAVFYTAAVISAYSAVNVLVAVNAVFDIFRVYFNVKVADTAEVLPEQGLVAEGCGLVSSVEYSRKDYARVRYLRKVYISRNGELRMGICQQNFNIFIA